MGSVTILKLSVSPSRSSPTNVMLAVSSSSRVRLPASTTGSSLVFETVIVNAVKLADAFSLSVTVMLTPAYSPESVLLGVPVSAPVVESNVAQLGLLLILNVCVSSTSASVTVGIKL